MILEAIVTTVDENGCVNLAPMGPTYIENASDQPDDNCVVQKVEIQTGIDVRDSDLTSASNNQSMDKAPRESSPRNGESRQHQEVASEEGRLTKPEGSWLLRPFKTSRTYSNLLTNPFATIHVTDDALLFAKAAISQLSIEEKKSLVHHLDGTKWWPLIDCHRWFAVKVELRDEDPLRANMDCCVIHSSVVRPFFGFNRAKHAVIEAAILATRTHLLPAEEVLGEMERLQPLIEKTGGPEEHLGFELLNKTIRERYARN